MNLLMFDLLKNFYNKAEDIKGKKLVYTLVIIFVIFTIIGLSIGYFMLSGLKENENSTNGEYYSDTPVETQKVELEGKVIYVNPERYPMDDISYTLVDSSGKDIFLLKAKDQKLTIAEGLNVKVIGKMGKLSDGKTDVLIVDEVIIKSAAD